MKGLKEFYITLENNTDFAKLKNRIFKLILKEGDLYVANFDSSYIFPVKVSGEIEEETREFLQSGNNHFATVKLIEKYGSVVGVGIYEVFQYKMNFDKLSIYYEDKYPYKIKQYETINGQKAMLVYFSVYAKDDNVYYVSGGEDSNDAYQVSVVDDINGNSSYLKVSNKRIVVDKDFQSYLFVGNIEFVDEKDYISVEDKMKLESIKGDINNYLNIWNKYNELELESLFDKFKSLGYVKFTRKKYSDDSSKLELIFDEEDFKKLDRFKDNIVNIGGASVLELLKVNDFDGYKRVEKSLLGKKDITNGTFSQKDINRTERTVKFKIKNIKDFDGLKYGYICLSLLGDSIAYERRRKAWNRVITGTTGIQNMYTWFIDSPRNRPQKDRILVDPSLLKHKNLTVNQLEALNVICNTPDIAIIQGPPGTGKTTIISEALTQINAKFDKEKNFGSNLLTGFRHETVFNMTDKIKLYGLPAIKVGEREQEDESQLLEPKVVEYIDELIERLNDKYEDLIVEDADLNKLQKIYANYLNFYNSTDTIKELLDEVRNLESFRFKFDIYQKIGEYIELIDKEADYHDIEKEQFVELLYSIPTNEEAYYDDIENFLLDLKSYENSMFKDDVLALEKELKKDNLSFDEIKKMRTQLILKHRKVPSIFANISQKMDIANYLYSLIEELKIERLKKRNGKQIAILDYIDSLKENPILLRETLLNYTRVLGATNQQTLSKKMTEVKKNDSFFENVFIDEAATSSPLDLFIPMSVAKGRIILVGDHKQLPNIVNENIVKKIEKDSISGEDGVSYLASQIKTTMFERLIETAHKLEEKDGIRRVITLNTQFRMHPKLGDIVSRNFYMDEGGLKSVKPESDFAHNYKGLNNKYLYWIDVPYNEAYKEKYRVNNSRRNKDEAEKIAQHIKEALNSDTYNNETIGVITFYREQVHEIKEALRVKGIFDDNYNLTAYYSGLDLLVGTVDAFQGKEFDVVYLSIVYTYDEKDSSRETYSRLKLFTLLNVAVSRQKKLLICVGDMKIFKTERAKNYVPCMYEISKICEGGGLHE